jgi:hypothetical protein
MARTIGIRVFKGDELQGVHTFERDIIKIGRLASAHLRLEDPKVSRIHAVIDIAAGRDEVSIIDMGSAEGTKVNGEKISRVQVKHGDEVGLGDSRLVLVLEESEVAALTGDDAGADAPAPTAVGQETEAIPGRGQLSSLPAPDNRETDVFSGGDPETGADGELTEAALAELRSSIAPGDTGVFEGGSLADAPVDDDGGAFAPPAGGSHTEGAPQPPTQPPTAAGTQPPLAAQPMPPMVAPPLPPIPEDPVTPANRFVEVELRWSGSVVDVKRVREQETFTVGVLGTCDMFLPMEDVGGGASFDLLTRAGDEWVLNITPQMGGSVVRGGQAQPLASAAAGGGLTLGDDVMVELSIGYFTLVVKTVSKSKIIPIVPLFDMFMINTALVTLFGMVSLISAMLLAPVGLDDGSDDLLENSNQFQTILLKQPKKNEFLEKFQEKQKASKKTQAAQGKNSKAGDKKQKKTATGKMAVKAPKKPTDAEVVAAKMKALGLSGESGGIAAIFGPTNGGGELEAALGNISGNKVAAAYGAGGLGVRGAAPGGGGGVGVGTVGIGRVGTLGRGSGNASYGGASGNLGARADRDVKISSGKPIILGSLDKEIIRRVVREHMAQIRYCYERELTKTPGIYGKIVMKWIINGQGKVTQAKVAETQMNNKNVESCIARKILTWRFPKPKGGGIVIVNYPFVFKQSN